MFVINSCFNIHCESHCTNLFCVIIVRPLVSYFDTEPTQDIAIDLLHAEVRYIIMCPSKFMLGG